MNPLHTLAVIVLVCAGLFMVATLHAPQAHTEAKTCPSAISATTGYPYCIG